jgi:hypothetical protein
MGFPDSLSGHSLTFRRAEAITTNGQYRTSCRVTPRGRKRVAHLNPGREHCDLRPTWPPWSHRGRQDHGTLFVRSEGSNNETAAPS